MVTLTAASTDTEVMTTLDASIRRARGERRALLIELRHNVESTDRYIAGDWPVDQAIKGLEVTKYESASKKKFTFSKLKKSWGDKIEKGTVGDVAQHEHFVGWTTEELISHIYSKVEVLQGIVNTNPRDRIVRRKGVRLTNIRKWIILLVKHIHS